MKRLITVLTLALSLAFATTQPALAFSGLFNDACTAAHNQSSACTANPGNDPVTGTNGVLYKVATIFAIITGVAAVILIIFGGFQYVTSGGDPQKAASARSMILGAVIGLVIVALAAGIIRFVLNKV